MRKALDPQVQTLERRFAAVLRRRCGPEQTRALLAISPAAMCRFRRLDSFFEQVEYSGRRLAKLNTAPETVREILRGFGEIADDALGGAFQPAREQLELATIFELQHAYYQVRESEVQAFFGLYQAEIEAAGIDDLLIGFVTVLMQAFRARAGRVLLGPAGLTRPRYSERGHTALWSYPLTASAVVEFEFSAPYPWLPRELALLDAAASRAQLAVEMRRLQAEAREAEDRERRRIGRELHDEAGQSLMLLRLQLEMAEREAPAALRGKLQAAGEIASRTAGELRRIVAALIPEVLERLGLERAMGHLAKRLGRAGAAEIRVRIVGSCDGLPVEQQQVVYRVAQESLQNILKHSGASAVNVLLKSTDRKISLRVSDNGAGFCAETAADRPQSFGLSGMRERATLLGGTLAVRSAPGKGAMVLLELPAARVGPNGKDPCIVN